MLVLAPYKVSEKKANKAAIGARKGLRRRAVIDSSSEDAEADSSHGDGEEKNRKATPQGEARTPKKGRTSLLDYSTMAAYSKEEWLPRGKLLAKS